MNYIIAGILQWTNSCVGTRANELTCNCYKLVATPTQPRIRQWAAHATPSRLAPDVRFCFVRIPPLEKECFEEVSSKSNSSSPLNGELTHDIYDVRSCRYVGARVCPFRQRVQPAILPHTKYRTRLRVLHVTYRIKLQHVGRHAEEALDNTPCTVTQCWWAHTSHANDNFSCICIAGVVSHS